MRFSIVTPVYNGEKYIRQTIESVLSQKGDFSIEYIVVDGLSTDNTVIIAQEYIDKLARKEIVPKCTSISMSCISEKDRGMYDAINKGFEHAEGDILAWINADDYYLPDTFQTVAKTFKKFPEIDWLKGRTCITSENPADKKVGCAPCYIFNQSWIQRGIYGRNAYFINQDSVFWKRSLWNKVRPIDTALKSAGDYWLWVHLAQYAPLYSVDKKFSVFRMLSNSLAQRSGTGYRDEQKSVAPPSHDFLENRIKLFFWLKNKISAAGLDWLFTLLYPLLFKREQKEYIDVNMSGDLAKRRARSFIA